MKDRYFQFIRGILIFLVILIHCMYQNDSIYSNYINIVIRSTINFCVAVFIFLSGYFTNREKVLENSKKYIHHRFKRLVIPLFIFSLLYTFIGILKKDVNLVEVILKFISFKSAPHLYYIVVLFQLVVLTPIILKALKNKYLKIILYLITPMYLIFLGVLKIGFNIDIPFYQYYFAGWLIYYILGLEHDKIKVKSNPTILILTLTFTIITNICVYNINTSTYNYVTSQLNICNMLYILVIIPIFLDRKSKYISSKINSVIEKIGDFSFGIYFIHILVLKVLGLIFEPIKLRFILYYILMSISTLVISYILIYLFKKITKNKFDKYLGF